MPRGLRVCPACNSQNHMRRTCCEQCGANFKPGRPSGTTEAAGYGVGHSSGRTRSTTEAAGYGVGHSTGRTRGTTEAAGYGVGHSSGRTRGPLKLLDMA